MRSSSSNGSSPSPRSRPTSMELEFNFRCVHVVITVLTPVLFFGTHLGIDRCLQLPYKFWPSSLGYDNILNKPGRMASKDSSSSLAIPATQARPDAPESSDAGSAGQSMPRHETLEKTAACWAFGIRHPLIMCPNMAFDCNEPSVLTLKRACPTTIWHAELVVYYPRVDSPQSSESSSSFTRPHSVPQNLFIYLVWLNPSVWAQDRVLPLSHPQKCRALLEQTHPSGLDTPTHSTPQKCCTCRHRTAPTC
jgi:hypothetical protein